MARAYRVWWGCVTSRDDLFQHSPGRLPEADDGDRGCTMGSLSMTGYAVGLDQELAGGD